MTLKLFDKLEKETNIFFRALFTAQLVEQSLPIPEVCSSNPVTEKNCNEHIMSSIDKTKIKKKRPRTAHLKTTNICFVGRRRENIRLSFCKLKIYVQSYQQFSTL